MDYRKGYIGLTDADWYEFLSTQPAVDEVNDSPRFTRAMALQCPPSPGFRPGISCWTPVLVIPGQD